MKPKLATIRILRARAFLAGLAGLAIALPITANATSYVKANTATMSNASDWLPTTPWPPLTTDTLSWNASPILLANNLSLSLGMDFSVLNLDLRPNGTNNPSLKIAAGNTITLNNSTAGGNVVNQSNGAWNTTLGCDIKLAGTMPFNIQGNMVVNGNITQDTTPRILTKTGSGALLFTGVNSYTGTIISKGILSLGPSATLGSTTAGVLTLSGGRSGTTLDLGGTTQTIGGVVNFGSGELRNGTLIINASGNSITKSGLVSANLQGTGNLFLDDSGLSLILSGTNTYSGTTVVQGGTLLAIKPAALPNAGASGTITLNSANSATLAVRAGGSGEWSATDIKGLLDNATFTVVGTSAIGLGIDTTGGDFTYGNAIPAKANMGLLKLGSNTLTLAAANLDTRPTTITRGTVKVDNTAGGSLANTSALTFTGAGAFNYNTASTSQGLGALTFSAGEGTVQITRSADAALTFASLAARAVGASANLSLSGGSPSATNGFNLTGAALGFIN
ncbi:MAG: autotransporter-associated beta strand repeat-containing protein, partial [Verrucomicrobiota bacterium]